MARINIEDSLFNDARFLVLKTLVGDEITAIGKLVVAWKTAQSFWLKDELIPLRFWELLKLDEVVESDFAEIKESGVYVRGIEEQFAWLKQKQEAGKKSGESRRDKKRTADERDRTDVERTLNETRTDVERKVNGGEPLTLTPSLTLTQDKKEGAKIKPDIIINLFNEILANKGRIQKFKGYYFPTEMMTMFLNTSGSPEFSTVEKWEEYFKLVASRKKLLDYPATLKFLIKHDNALEILNGGYQDKQDTPRPVLKGNQDALAMSSKLYSDVLKVGMHGLKEYLANLGPKEKQAIDHFGMASEILRAQNEYDANQIKNRLKEACAQALTEQRTG